MITDCTKCSVNEPLMSESVVFSCVYVEMNELSMSSQMYALNKEQVLNAKRKEKRKSWNFFRRTMQPTYSNTFQKLTYSILLLQLSAFPCLCRISQLLNHYLNGWILIICLLCVNTRFQKTHDRITENFLYKYTKSNFQNHYT